MSEIRYISLIDLINSNPYNIEDIKNQYLSLLSIISTTDLISPTVFVKNVERISKFGSIIVGVINNFEIVGSGTIIIEPKIIRGGKSVGHIEDIVVRPHMIGQGISHYILNTLRLIARENNCYKIILECDNEVKNDYIKIGFEVNGVQMVQYFV